MREVQFIPKLTKTHILGTAFITVHGYDLLTQQYRQSNLLNKALTDFVNMKHTKHYNWQLKVSNSGIRYEIDTEQPTELSHAILDLEFTLKH